MKPCWTTSRWKSSLVTKWYSRPSCSPVRGARVVCDMLKPNLSGYSLKRRWRIVDLPVPLGPEMTTARRDAMAEVLILKLQSTNAKAGVKLRPPTCLELHDTRQSLTQSKPE
jgi:hypothetical protein